MGESTEAGTLCIGVDGGATGFRVGCVVPGVDGGLQIRGGLKRGLWPTDANFVHLTIGEQRAQLGGLRRIPGERELERAWVQGLAGVIRELLGKQAFEVLHLGIALPGQKDDRGRGVLVMAHGPRLPEFSSALEMELDLGDKLRLCALGSDGQDAGRGEEWGQGGAFWGQASALYLGLGTGLAEAVKLDGELLAAQVLAGYSAPPWEAQLPGGAHAEQETIEQAVSLGAIQGRLEAARGPGLRPLDAARMGEPLALELFTASAEALGAWVEERITILNAEARHPVTRLVIGGSGAELLRAAQFEFYRVALQAALPRLELLPSALQTSALFGAAARAWGLTGSRPAKAPS
ncbi:MAG: hypothetical protein CMJ86_02645 [Planctomycetes bacterium]|nr:hypothetical protein [Planctomycetota bacterium]